MRCRYMIALVHSASNTAQLYIDFKLFGSLFLPWDSDLYQFPNVLELEMIQMEGRADLKVFYQALDEPRLMERFAYRNAIVSHPAQC